MEVDEFDSFLCLFDELKAEDHNTRLHAINSLDIIASAIGEEKTRSELVPYTNELLEDENEEVLLALAAKLGELSKYIGDKSYLPCLLPPLNSLCSSEESIVQEKALNSLKDISSAMDQKEVEEHLVPILEGLSSNGWCSSRIASCSLFPIIILKLSLEKQEDMLELFVRLANDTGATVRKAAAASIGKIAESMLCEKIIKLLQSLLADENDSVRQMALESVTKVIFDENELLEIIKKFATDKSWRVRFALLEHINTIVDKIQTISPAKSEILALFNDPEAEVRCMAMKKSVHIAQKLPRFTIETELVPCFEKLSHDGSQYVRLALMQSICQVSQYIDSKTSTLKLLPIINQLIRDESFEVRMSFAENMNYFNLAIGPDKVLTFSIPLIMQMMNDSQWRLRLKVVECLPQVAVIIGPIQFTEQMSAPLMKWVEDPVFAVRDATLDAIFNIGNRFGSEWTKGQIFHLIEMLVSSPVFTKRMTALKAINKLHSLLDYSDCVNFLTTLSTDRIPNIRFNVAKTMQNLAKEFRIDSELVGIVEKMKSDCDLDVRFYAGQALLSICGKR